MVGDFLGNHQIYNLSIATRVRAGTNVEIWSSKLHHKILPKVMLWCKRLFLYLYISLWMVRKGHVMVVAHSISSSQPTTQTTLDWPTIDEELLSMISLVCWALNCDAISTDKATSVLPDLIEAHFQRSGALSDHSLSGPHCDRAIIHLTERLHRLKNYMRPSCFNDFMTSVHLHNKALHSARKDLLRHSSVRQEWSFHKKPWMFAQSTCRPSQKVAPNFSAEQCLQYFQSIVSSPTLYHAFPEWISEVWPVPGHYLSLICLLFVRVRLNIFWRDVPLHQLTMEHIFCIDSLLSNARSTKKPIIIFFLYLKNAFGSICHQYLFDVLRYINLPNAVVSYLISCYFQLSAYVSTIYWLEYHNISYL